MATTDVIFRIGTMGITQTQAELGAVVAGLVAIGRQLAKEVGEADKFSDAWSRLSDNQKKQVQAMDEATKGFVSTMTNMTSAGKLGAAGLKPTSDQMAALALVGADTAKKLGEGPEGAARRIEELTNALIKGSDRGLKPYGIDLKFTGTLAEKQAEAFAKLTERAKGLEIQIDGLDDKWAALINTFDKTVGLTYDSSDGWDWLGKRIDDVTGMYSDYNKMMVTTNGRISELVSAQNLLMGVPIKEYTEGTVLSASRAMAAYYGWADAVEWLTGKQKEHNKALLDSIGFSKSGYKGPYGYTDQKETDQTGDKGGVSYAPADTGASRLTEAVEAMKKPRGGGGGRRAAAQKYTGAELPAVVQIEESYQRIVDLQEQSAAISDVMAAADEQAAAAAEAQAKAAEAAANYEKERLAAIGERMQAEGLGAVTYQEQMDFFQAEYEHAVRMLEIEMARRDWIMTNTGGMFELQKAILATAIQTSVSGNLMARTWQTVTGATGQMIGAMIEGSGGGIKAIKKMISETLQSISIEYGIYALTEAAQAIISAASFNYPGAAMHTAAAVTCAAVSVAAGAASAAMHSAGWSGGGGAKATAGGGGGMGGAYAGGGGGSGGSYGGGDYGSKPTEIVINVDGSLAGIFQALTVTAKSQKKSGAWQGAW